MRKMMARSPILLVCFCWVLFLAACAASRDELRESPEPDTVATEADANAVVLLNHTTARFLDDGGTPVIQLTKTLRVRVVREVAAPGLTHVSIAYQKGFSRVVSLHARVTDPTGRRREFFRRDASDVAAMPAHVLYSDTREVRLYLGAAPPGSLIEWTATVELRDTSLPVFEHRFGGSEPVRVSRLDILAPTGWRVEYTARLLDQQLPWQPVQDQVAGETRLSWVRRGLPALRPEAMAPAPGLLLPSVHFRLAAWRQRDRLVESFRDLPAMSSWMYRLVQPDSPPSPAVAALAKQVIAGQSDPAEQARLLYEWVRDHIKYTAIEIGYGGYIPHAPDDIVSFRYGDCKDKANLLRALLAASGLHSHLVLLLHHEGYPVRLALPEYRFDHMILAIDLPGGTLLVDPTAETVPFGELPWSDQDADVLPVTQAGASLARAPLAPAEQNSQDSEFRLNLDGQAAVGTFHSVSRGVAAAALRKHLDGTPDPRQRRAIATWLGVAADSQVESLEAPRAEDDARHGGGGGAAPKGEKNTQAVRGRLTLPARLHTAGATSMLRLAQLAASWVAPLPEQERRAPVVLSFCRRQRQIFHLSVPSTDEVTRVPEPVDLDTPIGRYRLSWSHDGTGLHADRELELRRTSVAPADYAALRAFFAAILAAEQRPALLHLRTS